MGGRLFDWLGAGLAADLPAAAGMAALLSGPGCTALYFETDTSVLNVYDESGPSWFAIDAAALSAIAFLTLPDVDPTGLADGQVFKWDAGASKMVPLSLLYQTAESIQDLIGAMISNGSGMNVTYDDGAGQLSFATTIFQYTDELAQDALAAAFSAGTHTGITITYDDATNKFSLAIVDAYINGLIATAVAAVTLDDVADVDYPSAPTNGQTLVWNSGTGKWEPGAMGGYTDEQARDAIAAMLAAGTHTGITVTNNDPGDSMSLSTDLGALHLQDQRAAGTDAGGLTTGAWRARPLCTAVINTISGAVHVSSVVTITIASPGVVTWNSHGLANGTPIRLATTGALPTGLVAGTIYYVVSAAANTFQLAATSGGAAINTSGSQSGVHTAFSNQFELPAGTYDVQGSAPSRLTDYHQARLQNLTDATTPLTGTTEISRASSSTDGTSSSLIRGRFVIAGTKRFEMQHQCSATQSPQGMGGGNPGNSWGICVYADIFIKKVA